jgi:hypothetical protein
VTSFLSEVESTFPPLMRMPEELQLALRWMEENGFVRNEAIRYALLYPAMVTQRRGIARTHFTAVDPDLMSAWLGNDDPSVTGRVAPFIVTGGEGSQAGIWMDDNGVQRFVHLGSGSGSTLSCVLADNAIDFLRLLAIGYEEICWPEVFAFTAEDAYANEHRRDERVVPYRAPVEFRHWVESTFHVTVPRTASEIVTRVTDMDASLSDDPFWQWARKAAG